MNTDITNLFDKAKQFSEQGRLTLAQDVWEESRLLTEITELRALATYELGVLYWMQFGNGVAARNEFLLVIKDFEINGHGNKPEFKMVHANAVENAMLCALSYDEFEELAEKLRILAPNEPILSGLFPKVQKFRENGKSWAEFLLMNATGYYNRNDPKLDPGHYGEAMSTYHLLLENRQKLRLTRNNWHTALAEYGALAGRLMINCQMLRGGDNDFNSPEEFLPIIIQTLPFIDEYLASNPGDKIIKGHRDRVNDSISFFRQRWSKISSLNTTFPRPQRSRNFNMSQPPSIFRKEKKGIFSLIFPVICTIIGIFLGNLWGGVIGMLIGLAIIQISNFSRKQLRHFRCDFCGRFFEKVENPNKFMQGMGVTIRTDQLMSGREGFGHECAECQRTICSDCEVFCSDNETLGMKCRCGSVKFRSVHLVYR